MSKLLTIPDDIDELIGSEDVSIDMSDLRFDIPDEKKKFYSFVFIRNSGIKPELNFERCSFRDKEEFLMLFLTTEIELKCPILASTWIEILNHKDGIVVLPSILTQQEIELFVDNNREFVDKCRQFINSLPIYALYSFHQPTEEPMDFSEFKHVECDDIKLTNFYQLAETDNFILLLETNPEDSHKPVFYDNIFNDMEKSYDMMRIMENLPYTNFLIAMFSGPDVQVDILNRINSHLGPEDNVKEG